MIKIWNALADNKLIDKSIAKESIQQILTKKGGGIINKMGKKASFDYYIFLSGAIIIPIFLFTSHIFFTFPFPNLQSYMGLTAVELFFIYMLSASIHNRKVLSTSFNNESIKESIVKVDSFLKNYLKKYFIISLVFGYIFLFFALAQFITRIGGVKNISFSTTGFNLFASRFILVLLILMAVWPFLIKFEIRIRYSATSKDISQLASELNEDK